MKYLLLIALVISITKIQAQPPKTLSDVIVVYQLSVEDSKGDNDAVNAMKGTTKTVYIKGSKSRSDLVSSNYTQTTFYDSKTDTTVILRELGGARYMSYLSASKKQEQNKKFDDIAFTKTGETKIILGYECLKLVGKLKDGSSFSTYYAPSIIPANTEFEYQFKSVPGFVLEYETESENGKARVKYLATKITITPVPAAKFELPKSGYRIL